jgi:hypothetical protein
MSFDNYMLAALLKVMGKRTTESGSTAPEPETEPFKLWRLGHVQKGTSPDLRTGW